MKAEDKRACPVCGTLLAENGEPCPVCVLQAVLKPETGSLSDTSSELRFEHYRVLQNEDGTPIELGRGAMGVTYKALDVLLQRSAALKIINARLISDDSAWQRFMREARAAASVRHPNVASVFNMGEVGGDYFYAMEFVDGETLEKIIRRSGALKTDLALEIVNQVAAGLAAIHKQQLVHRDIKPSNIMVTLEDGRLETVKIIDLGLAKGVAEEGKISAVGSFIGTPGYASPEQFAGIGTDIRSDLYSLGITLWEMLTGKLPFEGAAADLVYQHQHAPLPTEKLKAVPAPVVALLEVLLEKDPGQRFQDPAQLQKALTGVKEALNSSSRVTGNDLRKIANQPAEQASKRKRRKPVARWLVLSIGCATGLAIGWWFFASHGSPFLNQRSTGSALDEKSIAVLPFDSLSDNKSDTYFADGVHDEILNNLAKIAQLKVISRTSVMQYRPDVKRDLRRIANTLGVAYILEGTVRRSGNHVRISTELVNARNDNAVWADSYDRDLTDIFAIQSEIAQAIAGKLTAALSPEEKKRIEARPTDNLEAYDLYLQANKLILNTYVVGAMGAGMIDKTLNETVSLLDHALRLDPKFTLANCASVTANAQAYEFGDRTPERRAAADAAMKAALELQPDLPEVHLAYTLYLYWIYRDYERARVQLDMARRSLPNNVEAFLLAGYMDRRQGKWDRALQEFNEAIARDPRNPKSVYEVAETLFDLRQFRAAWLQAKNGDHNPLRLALAALPASLADDTSVLCYRLRFALDRGDWQQAKQLIERLGDSEDDGGFGTTYSSVPVGCYSILLARLQGEQVTNPAFAQTRQQVAERVNRSPENTRLIAKLGLVDALLDNKNEAISEAKHATGMLPVSKDALHGPGVALNLAVVYAWTNELDLAFETLDPLTRAPNGLYYGDLKNSSLYEPLRKDPRYQKLLAELAPKD
jgi:serine/threonine protein kinase/Tfp pilus assembly protein PilF